MRGELRWENFSASSRRSVDAADTGGLWGLRRFSSNRLSAGNRPVLQEDKGTGGREPSDNHSPLMSNEDRVGCHSQLTFSVHSIITCNKENSINHRGANSARGGSMFHSGHGNLQPNNGIKLTRTHNTLT